MTYIKDEFRYPEKQRKKTEEQRKKFL